MICKEVDTELHENHDFVQISQMDRKGLTKRDITTLDKAITDLKTALTQKLQPQIDEFTNTYARYKDMNESQTAASQALLEGDNGEMVKNAVCPGYHDFFTSYLRATNDKNDNYNCGDSPIPSSELPELLTENGITFVQLPVELIITNCEVADKEGGNVRIKFRVGTNRFLQNLNIVRTFEYKAKESDKWSSSDDAAGTVYNLEFGKEYIFRAKFALKSNLSSFAYSKPTTLKYQKPQLSPPTLSKIVTEPSKYQEEEEEKEEEKERKKKDEIGEKVVSGEYKDVSYMSNDIQYYNGVFRAGNGYRLSMDDTIMTVNSSSEGWGNPAIGTLPLVHGVRNRWFFQFKKSSVIWVSAGITTDTRQNSGRDATTYWGISFHNRRLVKGTAARFSSVGEYNIPRGLDTDGSIFGVELDLRAEDDAKLYFSFWDDLGYYRRAFGGIDLTGKEVYPALSAFNTGDAFRLIERVPDFESVEVRHDDNSGIALSPQYGKISLSREQAMRLLAGNLDDQNALFSGGKIELHDFIQRLTDEMNCDDDSEEDENNYSEGEDYYESGNEEECYENNEDEEAYGNINEGESYYSQFSINL